MKRSFKSKKGLLTSWTWTLLRKICTFPKHIENLKFSKDAIDSRHIKFYEMHLDCAYKF